MLKPLLLLAVWIPSFVNARQHPLTSAPLPRDDDSFEFSNKVERVAVIGAGPNGLLHAATLLSNGFQVRLFERAPRPGGTWFYTDKTPVAAPFP